MNIKNLKKLVDKYDNLTKKQKKDINEQTIRQEYIDIFLNLLGWDVTNSENLPYSERKVLVEEFSNHTDKPDYTLRKYGQSQFFIEAKRPSIDIANDEKSIYQARKYGWNANHKIVVLTNFEQLTIYQTYKEPEEGKLIGKYKYREYNYLDYVDKFQEIYKLISRESVENGTFDKWINNITPENVKKDKLDAVFLRKINAWRVEIGKSLYESHNSKFTENGNLNYYVQKLLNQIVFLRFAEDNQLETKNSLEKLIDNEINTDVFLKELDKKYNSELFDDDTVEYVDKNVLREIILELYYPNSSFDFSIIPLDILSQMYENYLQKELFITQEGDVELISTRDIKIKSVVSTPNKIVKFMVKEALQDKLKGKDRNEILNLKILDIAVGSGVFLIESYNLIESYLIDYYSIDKKMEPSPLIVPFEDKVTIISKVLYGLDINLLAVQLTKFSLILRVLRGESRQKYETYPILPNLKENILHCNTLVEERDINILKISSKDIKDIVPSKTNFSEDLDVIIGNPPYLKSEDIKRSTTEEEINVYKEKYETAFRQYDKYFLFIEKAIKLSLENENLKTVLIVPNKFITSKSGEKLRSYIKRNRAIQKIINFRDTQLFENVITYVCIISLELNNEDFKYVEVNDINDIYIKNFLTYKTSLLTEEGWFLTNDKKFLKKYEIAMQNFPKITKYVNVSNGIQTSRNSIYIIKEREIISETSELLFFKKNNKEYAIEKSILKNYFHKSKSTDVGKSYERLKSNSYVIFPYDENGQTYSISSMKIKYPKAWEYLNEYKEELLNRDISGGDKKHWYRFGRSQHLKELVEDKIIVGVMSNQPNFNIDRKNYLISSGGTAGYIAIMKKENSPYSLEYLQAWLSHEFTDTIFKAIGSDFEGDFYTHGTYLYDAIPILPINFEDLQELKIYDNINIYVKEIEKLNLKIEEEKNEEVKKIEKYKKNKYIKLVNENIDELLNKKLGERNYS